ncbi:MAG: hypothetical protein U1E53_21360 [Dongiaceae bacterium]
MHVLKIVLINLAVIFAGWMAIIVVAAAWHDWQQAGSQLDRAERVRAMLPAYSDHEEAKQIWRELKQNRRQYASFIEWRGTELKGKVTTVDASGIRRHGGNRTGIELGMFGGSALWGMGVADAQTIPAAFERLAPAYKVTNYAEIGWNPRQSLNLLINLIHAGTMPKTVLFYDGFNDVIAMCDPQRSTSWDGTTEENGMRETLFRKDRGQLFDVMVRPVYDALSRFIGASTGRLPFTCSTDPVRAQMVADGVILAWQIAHDLVVGRGGSFAAFLQPVAFLGNPRIDYLSAEVDAKTRHFDAHKKEFEAVYPLIQKRMADLPWAHDLTRAFDNDQPLFIDTVHANGTGNEIIARRMLSVVGSGQSAQASP